MAKQHSSLTGVDLHDPKGIGAKNTTKVLHISQSVNKIDVSGSIIPTDNNAFQLGQSDKIFSRVHTNQITASGDISSSLSSTGSFGIIRVGGNNFDSAALGGGNFNTLTNVPSGIISGSGQLPNGIVSSSVLSSGAQGTITLTTNDVAANIDSGLQVGDSPTFAGLTSTGDVIVQGKLTAEVYAVSSSVTHMTRSFSSGSTIFGDTQNDTHQVTGSLIVTGSISATTFEGMISGSGQIASDISGSFNVSRLPAGTISGSDQLPSGIISGSDQLPSGVISGSAQLPSGIISGSNQIFTSVTSSGDISGSGTGSFGVINVGGGVFTSASLAAGGVSSYTDLTNVPAGIISGSGQLPSGVISGSSQLPSGVISGSLQLPSGIISGRAQLPNGTISGSEQIHDLNFVSSSTTNTIQVMTSASYAAITPVNGTLYIIQG